MYRISIYFLYIGSYYINFFLILGFNKKGKDYLNKIKKDIYGKPKYVKFEDTLLPVPEKTEEYLTKIYGDYMKLPSKEQIKAKEHTPYFLDFNSFKSSRNKTNSNDSCTIINRKFI